MAQPKSWPVTERTSWEESPSPCPTRQLGAGSHPCLSFFFFLLPVAHELWVPPLPLPVPWASQNTAGQTQSSNRGWWGTPFIPSTQVMALRSCHCRLLPFVPCHGSKDKAACGPSHAQIPETASTPEQGQHQGAAFPCQFMSAASLRQQHLLSPTSGFHCSNAQIWQAQTPELQEDFFLAFSLEISLFLAGGRFLWPQQTANC